MSPLVLALCLLAVVYFIYRFVVAPWRVLKRCGIKGPTPLPFLGNYREIARMKAQPFYQHVHKEYGPVSGFYLGKQPQVLVTDVEILKDVLVKDFNNFMDRPYFPDLLRKNPSHVRGLLSSRGDYWKFSRHILSPTFSTSKMKMMVPLVDRSVATLVERFGQEVEKGKSFEVFKTYGSFTMETILATAFGRVIEIQRGESDELTSAVDSIFRGVQEGESMSPTFVMSLLSNFPWLVYVARLLSTRTKRAENVQLLENISINLVKNRRQNKQAGKYKDLLQLMIDASEEGEGGGEEQAVGEKEGDSQQEAAATCPLKKSGQERRLTDREIVAHAITFILAGYETTSNTLAYTSYLLALNPDVQEKLQAEIDSYYDSKPEASSYEASQEITYLDNVIQESLRLYPPAPRISRECRETTTINGVTIPKGAIVMIPTFMLQTDPQYWKDPKKFDPNRFTAEERAKRPQLSHLPFGFGPRSCIGMRFALLEAKIALIELLKRYSFVRAADTEVPLQTVLGITMAPKNGVYLKVVNRN